MTDRQDDDEWTPPERDHYQEWADGELLLDHAARPEEFRLPGVCLSGNTAGIAGSSPARATNAMVLQAPVA